MNNRIACAGRSLLDRILQTIEKKTFRSAFFIFAALYVAQSLVIWDFGNFLITQLTNKTDYHLAKGIQAWRPDATGKVATVLIGDDAYENDFRQVSPLDRAKLTELIRLVASMAPDAMLAIDLDISPRGESLPGQDELDKLLADLGSRVLLVTPDRVITQDLAWAKIVWMQRLCAAGVRFASPDLRLRYGAIDPAFPVEGNLAGTIHLPTGSSNIAVCALAGAMVPETALLFWSEAGLSTVENDSSGATGQIRSEYFLGKSVVALNSISAIKDMSALRAADYVVLGGGWGPDDRYLTVAGERYGSEVHAAQIYSLLEPVGKAPALLYLIAGLVFVNLLLEPLSEKTLRLHFMNSSKHQRLRCNPCISRRQRRTSGRYFLFSVYYLVLFMLVYVAALAAMLVLNSVFRLAFSMDIGVATMILGTVIWLFLNIPRLSRESEENTGAIPRAGQLSSPPRIANEDPELATCGEIVSQASGRWKHALATDLDSAKRWVHAFQWSKAGKQVRGRTRALALADSIGGLLSFAFFFVFLFALLLTDVFGLMGIEVGF